MRGIEAVAAAYLDLVRDLTRLLPGLADAGPGHGRRRRPAELVRAAGDLAAEAAAAPGDRARFLTGQLRACEGTARRLAGQRVPLAAEIATAFGVRVARADAGTYRAAHRELAALLPGTTPLPDRLAASRVRVAPERLPAAVTALAGALREVTRARVVLPAGEGVAFRFVADAPWAALHSSAGPARSVVTVNAGVGFHAGQLARLVAHETYPGHHAARCRTEGGPPERAVPVVGTPQALIAEGAAEIALHAAVGPGWGRWVQDVLAGVGIAVDGELLERVDTVTARLSRARLDALLMLHGERARDADVRAFLRSRLLIDDARTARILTFLRHPLWRLTPVAYVEGATRVRAWWDADPSDARLALLLGGSLTPADLRPNEGSPLPPAATGGIREATSGRPLR